MTPLALLAALRLMLSPGTFDHAMVVAAACDTPTSWAEQVAPAVWIGVCGDSDGNPTARRDVRAELHWHMAGGSHGGALADAAFEDSLTTPEE